MCVVVVNTVIETTLFQQQPHQYFYLIIFNEVLII